MARSTQPGGNAPRKRARKVPRAERLSPEIDAILSALEAFLNFKDDDGRRVCGAKCGVYAFYDYDGEPIYVGRTYESLATRIRRHLTGQRTDAVAMHVLDPLEVARIEVWPFWDAQNLAKKERVNMLARAEYSVYDALTRRAKVSKLLNEKKPEAVEPIDLPQSYTAEIVPPGIRPRLEHRDERIARRAATIANLAQVVKERDVSLGLRQTLVTQAERLQLLATERLEEVTANTPAEQRERETERSATDAESA